MNNDYQHDLRVLCVFIQDNLLRQLLHIYRKIFYYYSQKLLDHAKQSARDALNTASERAIQKTAEATGDLIGNKISNKITKNSSQNNSEIDSQQKKNQKKYLTSLISKTSFHCSLLPSCSRMVRYELKKHLLDFKH